MRSVAVGIGAALALAVAAPPVFAHHSAGAYDSDHEMSAIVVLKKFVWENPHLYFDFDAKGPDGKTTSWNLEAGPPIMFLRGAIKQSDFQKGVGATVTMFWCPTKSRLVQGGIEQGKWQGIKFSDGTSIMHWDIRKAPPDPPGKCA